MKLKNNGTICVECNEVIYNLLCPTCLAKEVLVWAGEKDLRTKAIVSDEINRMLKKEKLYYRENCVACKSNRVFLCPYCFTNRIFERLKFENVNSKILADFLTIFNFDFEHVGYSKDMEELGLL